MTATATETDNPLVFQQMKYCDKCSVAKGVYQLWVDRMKSHDLVFCSHHFQEHEFFIATEGFEVVDL